MEAVFVVGFVAVMMFFSNVFMAEVEKDMKAVPVAPDEEEFMFF